MSSLLELVRDTASDKKAEDVLTIPLEGRSSIADHFVVITGRSKIQTRAIADGIAESVKEHGFTVARTEGYTDGNWILLDLGSIVVHVFTAEHREFYNLERLWAPGSEQRARTS